MKVCVLVNEYPPDRVAGTAIATRALARFLASRGVEVVVFVTERRRGSTVETSDGDGVLVHRLSAGAMPGLRWVIRVWRLRQLVVQHRPDLVHGQSISCGLYGRLACSGLRVPILVSIQGQDLYQATRLQRRTEVRWALRGAEYVTAVSQDLAALALAVTGVPHIEVVPHGFEPWGALPSRAVARGMHGISDAEFLVLCAARLDPIKGVDVLIRAIKDVPHATLWLAGEGAQRDALEALTRRLGVHGRIRFWGHLDRQSLGARLAAADVFVLPSRSEAFGIALVEAMHAGLPVVATRVGGIPELVGKENGILVPPADPAALAKAIRELSADPARAAAMRAVNKERAEPYRWERVGARLLAIYETLLQGGANP